MPPAKHAKKIRAMFGAIAPRYDLLNHLLSLNVDVLWRRRAVKELLATGPVFDVLDVACGTGDLAIEIARRAPTARVVGADFTAPMLRLAQEKSSRLTGPRPCAWIEADALRLPFPSQSFDAVTVAFGIRNMESLDGALAEMHRVLRPGGRLLILEFTVPENPLIRAAYLPYFQHVLPRIGALLSQQSAYRYLPDSVLHFPGRSELAARMRAAGYRRVRHTLLQMGVAALHLGVRAR